MQQSSSNERDPNDDTDITYLVLACGKSAGLSFQEMNLLRVQDVIAIGNALAGDAEDEEKDTVRDATQADIDHFYSS